MKRKLSAGLISVTLPIWVQSTASTTGGGLSGLTASTSGLVCEYRRQSQSSWTAITLSNGTLGTWASGTIVADGSLAGAYELDLPDAVTAAGARWVAVRLYGAANMLPVLIEIELDAVNYQDANGFGLSRLDAAVSSRSTYAGADTAGTATLLSRLTSGRATALDNLDAPVSGVAAAVWAVAVEGSRTAAGVLRLVYSSVANKLSGAATGTVRTRDEADTKDRLVVTVDTDGNRTAVVRDDT